MFSLRHRLTQVCVFQCTADVLACVVFRLQHLSCGSVSDNKNSSETLVVDVAFQQTLWHVAPICSGGGVAQGRFYILFVLVFVYIVVFSVNVLRFYTFSCMLSHRIPERRRHTPSPA